MNQTPDPENVIKYCEDCYDRYFNNGYEHQSNDGCDKCSNREFERQNSDFCDQRPDNACERQNKDYCDKCSDACCGCPNKDCCDKCSDACCDCSNKDCCDKCCNKCCDCPCKDCPCKDCDCSTRRSICALLKSIALMETALTHILNAEGEKLQKAVKLADNICDLLEIDQAVNTTITKITFLEQTLYSKLEAINSLKPEICIEDKEDTWPHTF